MPAICIVGFELFDSTLSVCSYFYYSMIKSYCFSILALVTDFISLQFVHCIVWAKDLLFAKLFGDKNQDNDLNVRSKDDSSSKTDVFERSVDEDLSQYAQRIYDHVFGYNIETALANEETWKNRRKPCPIYVKDALPEDAVQLNGSSKDHKNEEHEPSAMVSLGLRNPQEIWSLADNSRVFLEALKLFFEKREKVCIHACLISMTS